MRNKIYNMDSSENKYFRWLYDYMCYDRFSSNISYEKLFLKLYNTDFIYYIHDDGNRLADGMDLRYRFYLETDIDIERTLVKRCSVLEMMEALAIRIEETIMNNTEYGDRTRQWFWNMIKNLGLFGMCDTVYNEEKVDDIINRFLEREYEPDGNGGLFYIPGTYEDLTRESIWTQSSWYLENYE